MQCLAGDGLAEKASPGKSLRAVALGDLGKGHAGAGQSRRKCPVVGLRLEHVGQSGCEELAGGDSERPGVVLSRAQDEGLAP